MGGDLHLGHVLSNCHKKYFSNIPAHTTIIICSTVFFDPVYALQFLPSLWRPASPFQVQPFCNSNLASFSVTIEASAHLVLRAYISAFMFLRQIHCHLQVKYNSQRETGTQRSFIQWRCEAVGWIMCSKCSMWRERHSEVTLVNSQELGALMKRRRLIFSQV